MCVCIRANTHTKYLMRAQVWDGHLESQKNPDRLKRSTQVDHIGVQSTFVYIYAELRVLMIWANCFFLSTCLFFLKSKRCDDNQHITVSHFGDIKDCTLRVPNKTTTIFLCEQ